MTGFVSGKVAIVTGGGRGIGRAIAMLMAREGANVVVADVGAALDGSGGDQGPAHEVVKEIEAAGGKAIASTLSITEPQRSSASTASRAALRSTCSGTMCVRTVSHPLPGAA
jgi:NAD(P)-dependent dehydrogenase (short-subunit alcohol dehydrogenase family)